ncbi:AbrB family transcriptional regulator [Oceanobacillus kapialis]|uniref:AbrB family transcriptional regulator n=1 Tax=Oceanobacillus kapialis TaxID=481353 RepID=A0ABW5Q2X0_9BACI
MHEKKLQRLLITFVTAAIGGYIFYILHIPLPWVLGALTFTFLVQGFFKQEAYILIPLKNTGFIILGIYFGLYFTMETFQTVLPYFIPYLLLTFILIFACIFLSIGVTKLPWVKVDKMTSIFGCIPGGLSEMTIASEAFQARTPLVVIFQTIRLVTVLFMVPSVMALLFGKGSGDASGQSTGEVILGAPVSYLWFVLPAIAGLYLNRKIPAGIIIGAIGVTALINIMFVELPAIPPVVMNAAQVAVGVSLGKNILFRDLKAGGKLSFVYFGTSIIIIAFSLLLGVILTNFTSLDYITAILSIAPGGLFEMVLTAYSLGGDPALVSSLQLVRILVIVIGVPPLLGFIFRKRQTQARES